MIRLLNPQDPTELPVQLWLPYLEGGAEQQARNLAKLPFAFHHIAIMPDSHQGFGMPIGGVLATKDVIIPNAVGVDIGCGMCAVKTELRLEDVNPEQLKAVMGKIREKIPTGNGRGGSHEERGEERDMPFWQSELDKTVTPVVYEQYHKARTQLGTLGGGNHFIEIQHDTHGSLWIMIHSGSRNLGKQVGDFYNRWAKELNALWAIPGSTEDGKVWPNIPSSWQLNYLRLNTQPGKSYFEEMQLCVAFALANRKRMMAEVMNAFGETFQRPITKDWPENLINIAHNYAALETHFGEKVMVHRKGATLATNGLIGIIPGSQGSKSYIVCGKGNPESFMSCSHGAGRKMSRRQATERLNLEEEVARMTEQGIIHGIRNTNDLDEAPGAYKNIDEVMANQADLVDIVVELSPLAVVKG